ncbi:PLC-like phosphodiesterase [Pyronema domesticum]|nr:PLC-like phosphodiesterase [Pyronema domesticum]
MPSPRSLTSKDFASMMAQPISLPTPMISTSPPNESLKQQGSNLIRRVSQKAKNLRRRTSSHEQEERTGPVIVRNRSGSGSGEARLGIQHHDSLDDDDDEVAVTFVDSLDGPAYTYDKRKSMPPQHHDQQVDDAFGVIVPEELQKGTEMIRVTRKKKVKRLFTLDVNKARVSWDPTKQSSRFYVDDMKDIRTGANARNYREELKVADSDEKLWITITYVEPEGGKLKMLHVIAPDEHLFKIWTSTLEAINRYRTELMAGLAMQGEKFVEAHWKRYMANLQASTTYPVRTDRLAFEDIQHLCRGIHVNCSRRFLKEKFKRADCDNSGYLNFNEFERFVKFLKEREEIKILWEELVVNPSVGMHRNEFRAFLRETQQVDVDADSTHVDKVFKKYCRKSMKMGHPEGTPVPVIDDINDMRMNREAFAAFLLSPVYNPPLLKATVGQKLDRPLNEYYCSSSHNTYLMGRQVRGESSVEPYINVLQRGCRCVEIDCWDGADGRPVVTHGHTGTSECFFSDVISAIGKYAFIASPYPVVLSLEVHCSLDQQVEMARILVEKLGDALVQEPLMTNSFVLPSPEDLKHRILVKVKGSEVRDEKLLNGDMEAMNKRSSGVFGGLKNNTTATSSSNATSESDDPSSTGQEKKQKPPKTATKIAHELGRLGVYCRGQKFRNFALPESKTYNHIFSFQEKSFLKFCKDSDKKVALEKHNLRYIMRVYPSGFRVNSSNFDPIGFWRRGVQMVALNWQTYDLGVQLNDAMFASADDKSGYVLKPKALRARMTQDPIQDVADAKLKKDKKLVSFSIEVISAQQLPRPKDHKFDDAIDPFVEVEIFSADDKAKGTSSGEGGIDLSDSKGVSGLGAPQKRKTKVVKDDGFHPRWNERMRFSIVTKFEELVFVRFLVYHSEGGEEKRLLASCAVKLVSLQQGYRHLPLNDITGEQYLFSTLFVKIKIDPITLIERDIPQRGSTIENLKTSAKAVFNRGLGHAKERVENKVGKGDKDKEGKDGAKADAGTGGKEKTGKDKEKRKSKLDLPPMPGLLESGDAGGSVFGKEEKVDVKGKGRAE